MGGCCWFFHRWGEWEPIVTRRCYARFVAIGDLHISDEPGPTAHYLGDQRTRSRTCVKCGDVQTKNEGTRFNGV